MKKTFFLIIIIICTIILIFSFNNNLNEKNNIEPNFNWYAKYIWIENEKSENQTDENINKNTWACFRKDFDIENKDEIKDVICRIAVDSKYWLYINGQIVVRDGELKRGEKKNSIYYDELTIDNYLHEGKNNISILVWYFGKNGFSHVDSGQGALLFQAQIGNKVIISDETWKATKNLAFLKDEESGISRLSESNIYYDSNQEMDGWYLNDFDDSSWEKAIVYGEYNNERWGKLIKRDIPFFKFSDIKNYENEVPSGELLEMKLPYNMQIVPYLKVNSKANEKILISNNNYFENKEYYGKVTYITKDGIQEFESPSWINGDKIYYYIPEGVEIISLGYRETGYDSETVGNFESDDEDLNTLWTMANRTLYVNMRDTYMDCPDRERAMWIGDISVEMEEAMYSLDTNANALYEKSLKTFVGWQDGGALPTVSPSINACLHLPVQNLLAITSVYDYYEYTGNKDFVSLIYPNLKEYMNLWTFGDDGLVGGYGNYFMHLMEWYDSQGVTDSAILENIWYYYALQNMSNLSKVLELNDDYDEYQLRLTKMKQAINEMFWDGNGYKSEQFDGYDVRANSVAVLAGIADESKYEKISEVIVNNYDNSVFMEKYVLEALSKIGKISEVQNRIKTRYENMIRNQDYSTTLWEYWENTVGSKNHAWAGGPLVIMSKYFAGISPLKEGYSEILIKPQFGNLKKLSAVTDTVKGKIEMSATKENEQLNLTIDVPQKTLVAIEKMTENYNISINDKIIYKDKQLQNNELVTFEKEDDSYVYLYLDKGKYDIVSK